VDINCEFLKGLKGMAFHGKPISELHITQCYLPIGTSERFPLQPQPDRLVLDLPTLEGWKAELTLALVSHPSK